MLTCRRLNIGWSKKICSLEPVSRPNANPQSAQIIEVQARWEDNPYWAQGWQFHQEWISYTASRLSSLPVLVFVVASCLVYSQPFWSGTLVDCAPQSPSCSFPPHIRNGSSHQLWFWLKENKPFWVLVFLPYGFPSVRCKRVRIDTPICKVHLNYRHHLYLMLIAVSLPAVPILSLPTSSPISFLQYD
jgi:hypothetical protein